jgi:subtilisin family serine protease
MPKIAGSVLLMLIAATCFGQKIGWQNLDLKKDGVFGASTERTYQELKGKPAHTVIVAVIDAGVDINHEDLRTVIWTNKKEIPGNGLDDDHNGYIDDVHGWNFTGSSRGSITYDNIEAIRVFKKLRSKFADSRRQQDTTGLALYKSLQKDIPTWRKNDSVAIVNVHRFQHTLDSLLLSRGNKEFVLQDTDLYKSNDPFRAYVGKSVSDQLKTGQSYAQFYRQQITEQFVNLQHDIDFHLNPDYDPRKGNPEFDNKFYGNADVAAYNAMHGTLVAGIIAADRNNNMGVKGIADHVLIMPVRTAPDGEDRDIDVANSIRYAVNNGAKIINLSFGKSSYSPDKRLVDEAVKYAMSKDVLIIHAAGNGGVSIDDGHHYPNAMYEGGSDIADAWIEVGASGYKNDESLVLPFSNYGALSVDVFAPGDKTVSTYPGSKYEPFIGTSMAAPVVSGIAALIREYYPGLRATAVKDIIMRSAIKVDHKVRIKQNDKGTLVDLSELCVSGGIANAYEALKMAATYK